MIDYRELLKKYMAHVLHWDGSDYTELMEGSSIPLDEQEELKSISREVSYE